jgi:hypothetical protein
MVYERKGRGERKEVAVEESKEKQKCALKSHANVSMQFK